MRGAVRQFVEMLLAGWACRPVLLDDTKWRYGQEWRRVEYYELVKGDRRHRVEKETHQAALRGGYVIATGSVATGPQLQVTQRAQQMLEGVRHRDKTRNDRRRRQSNRRATAGKRGA